MEYKQRFLERAADLLDLPGDIIADLPRLQVIGCREVLLENHKGILEYGSEKIHINGGQVIVKFEGENLQIRSMTTGEMRIVGRLFTIEFMY